MKNYADLLFKKWLRVVKQSAILNIHTIFYFFFTWAFEISSWLGEVTGTAPHFATNRTIITASVLSMIPCSTLKKRQSLWTLFILLGSGLMGGSGPLVFDSSKHPV